DRETNARSVSANLHLSGIVLGAVEQVDFSVANDGAGIEGVQRFPVNRSSSDRILEGGVFEWADDGLGVGRTLEGVESPGVVGVTGTKGGGPSRHADEGSDCRWQHGYSEEPW